MGVEPTRDRAERPPSRFEDGETHRGPYTSMLVAVLCHSCSDLSSERTNTLHIYLGQAADRQFRRAQTRQVAIPDDRYTAHAARLGCLHARHCVFDDQTMRGWNSQLFGGFQKDVGRRLSVRDRLAGDKGVQVPVEPEHLTD